MVTLTIKRNPPTQECAAIHTWDAQGIWHIHEIKCDTQETIQSAIDLVRKELPEAVAMELVVQILLRKGNHVIP